MLPLPGVPRRVDNLVTVRRVCLDPPLGHQQQDPGILEYSGTWFEETLAPAFGGSTTHSNQAGATLTFTGTDVSWAAQRGPDRGRAEVWLDGALVWRPWGPLQRHRAAAQGPLQLRLPRSLRFSHA